MRGLNGMPGIDGQKGEPGETGKRGDTGVCAPEQCLPPPTNFQMEEPMVDFDDLILSRKEIYEKEKFGNKKANFKKEDIDSNMYTDFDDEGSNLIVPDVKIVEGSGYELQLP